MGGARCGRPLGGSGAKDQRAMQATQELGLVSPAQLVLPDANHFPTAFPQSGIHAAVASPVGRDLVAPERRVGLRLGGVLGAAVPETTVDEDGDAETPEHEIGADAGASPVIGYGFLAIGSGHLGPCSLGLVASRGERQ